MSPAIASAVAAQPELSIDMLQEFPDNPRRHWGDMDGLAESIKANGIIEPLVVRQVDDYYQIIAGARRFRAAQLAGLATVPVTLREASDAVALELAIIENLQRHDVHPLDEALGIEHLMKTDRAYTIEAVGAKLGKSARAVRDRLVLLNLTEPVRQAFTKDEITAGHATLIARLDPKLQRDALEECFDNLWRGDKLERMLQPLRELEAWIEDHVPVNLDAEDTRELFPDAALAAGAAAASGTTIARLADAWQYAVPKPKKGELAILSKENWKPAKTKDACAVTGVVVLGPTRGAVQLVCIDQKCKTHFVKRQSQPSSGATRTASTAEERKKKAAVQRKREETAAANAKAKRDQQELVAARALTAAAAAVSETAVTPWIGRALILEVIQQAWFQSDALMEAFTQLTGISMQSNQRRVPESSLKKLPDAKVGPALVFLLFLDRAGDERGLRAALAPFKVDVKKIDRDVEAEQKAAAKAKAGEAKVAAKKKPAAKKKGAKKR